MPNAPDSPSERVLIAGVSARAMAESAARAGYAVTTLDAFGDLDQYPGVRALSVPRDMAVAFTAASAARAAKELAIDVVAYLSPFENHPREVDRLADGRMLWGNDSARLRQVRNPGVLAEVLRRHGVVTPDIAQHAGTQSPADDEVRWLLKPRASGGGHGVRWWQPGEAVSRGSYVQQFIDGVPASVAFVAAGGTIRLLSLTRQLVGDEAFGATGFRYCGSILAPAGDSQLARDADLMDAVSTLATVVAREFELVGVTGIDFIASDGVPVPIEVNPRYSASMELTERAYGVSVFAAHAAACATGDLPLFDLAPARVAGQAHGKAIVFARHDVTCGDTRSWLDDPTVRDIPHPGEHIAAGRPVCTVFATGMDAAACYDALVRRAEYVYETLGAWAGVAV